MRQTLFIAAIVIVLLGVGLTLYFIFFTGEHPTLTVDTTPNPFEEAPNAVTGGEEETDGPFKLTEAGKTIAPRFVKITDGPVAYGSMVFAPVPETESASASATTTPPVPEKDYVVRYAERANGNLYEYSVMKRTLTRISNRTIPGVYEASWLPDGSLAYLRYSSESDSGNETVETYALPVTGDGGFFLEPGLSQVLVKDLSTVLTLLPSSSSALGSLIEPDGTSTGTAFTSPLSSVHAAFLDDGFLLTTKASGLLDGYAFSIANGRLTRLLGPLRGLVTLPSPSGSHILYNYINRGALALALFDTETRVTTALPVNTLAEKCVWRVDETAVYCAVPRALSGTLPDAWYQGAVVFSDRVWTIDIEGRVAVLTLDPSSSGGPSVDAVSPALDAGANVLIFTDRRSGALYLYDL